MSSHSPWLRFVGNSTPIRSQIPVCNNTLNSNRFSMNVGGFYLYGRPQQSPSSLPPSATATIISPPFTAEGGTKSDSDDMLEMAVPKKKISRARSRKRRGAYDKQRKNITNIENCWGCGKPKLRFHTCLSCTGWQVS